MSEENATIIPEGSALAAPPIPPAEGDAAAPVIDTRPLCVGCGNPFSDDQLDKGGRCEACRRTVLEAEAAKKQAAVELEENPPARFTVLFSGDVSKLENLVDKRLALATGWRLHGPLSVSLRPGGDGEPEVTYVQALTRSKEDADEEAAKLRTNDDGTEPAEAKAAAPAPAAAAPVAAKLPAGRRGGLLL